MDALSIRLFAITLYYYYYHQMAKWIVSMLSRIDAIRGWIPTTDLGWLGRLGGLAWLNAL